MITTRKLVRVALGAATLAISAWLIIPGPIPFTMQTMAVLTVSALLGPWQGCAAVGVYLLLGAAGAPVFSGFRGGLQVLLGATGGYLVGFLLTALLTGWVSRRWPKGWQLPCAMVAASVVCYAFGTAWYAVAFAHDSVGGILATCVLPFLLPDAVKLVLSLIVVRRVRIARVFQE